MVTYVVVQWDGTLRQAEVTGNMLSTFQSAVGGYLEALTLAPDLVAYINEDGYVLECEPNPLASAMLRALGSTHYFGPAGAVLGSVVFVGLNGPQEVSLRPDQLNLLAALHAELDDDDD